MTSRGSRPKTPRSGVYTSNGGGPSSSMTGGGADSSFEQKERQRKARDAKPPVNGGNEQRYESGAPPLRESHTALCADCRCPRVRTTLDHNGFCSNCARLALERAEVRGRQQQCASGSQRSVRSVRASCIPVMCIAWHVAKRTIVSGPLDASEPGLTGSSADRCTTSLGPRVSVGGVPDDRESTWPGASHTERHRESRTRIRWVRPSLVAGCYEPATASDRARGS